MKLTWKHTRNYPEGRNVRALDPMETFVAEIPDSMTLEESIADYEASADYNGDAVNVEFTLMHGDAELGLKIVEITA